MNRKLFLACLLFVFFCTGLYAQIRLEGYRAGWINSELFVKRWPASWISCPGDDGRSYGVYHFRKSFELAALPDSMVAHVSADNRYKLYVNGRMSRPTIVISFM